MGTKNSEKKKKKRIEKFKKLCYAEQYELKEKLRGVLLSMGYTNLKNEDGFLYAKGEIPVLLVAHMDTVHKMLPMVISIETKNEQTYLSSPFGIGGDDRCGIYMILEIIKTMKCSVLFTEDEERGCIGADKFANTRYVDELDVNYIIEFDRRGHNDAVFYNCDNPDFEDFITSTGFFETNFGSCSDISSIAPASGIAAVNLSCGYYKEHTLTEHVIFEEMEAAIDAAKELIEMEVNEPFEYVERKDYYNGYYYGSSYGWGDDYGYGYNYSYSTKTTRSYLDKFMVGFYKDNREEDFAIIEGFDQSDATLEFLKKYDTVPYKDIIFVWSESQLEKMGVNI